MKHTKIVKIIALFMALSIPLSMLKIAADSNGQQLKDKFDESILESADTNEEYKSYLEYSDNDFKSAGEVSIELPLADALCPAEKVINDSFGKNALIWHDEDYFEWNVNITSAGLYEIETEYCPITGKGIEIQRKVSIDGGYPFEEAQNIMFYRNYIEKFDNENRELTVNRIGNEVRPQIIEAPKWNTVHFSNGQCENEYPFRFYLTEGMHSIRLENLSEPMAISYIKLVGSKDVKPYSELKNEYSKNNYKEYSGENIKIQSENASDRNKASLRRENYGDLSCEPYSYVNKKLNVVGDASWSSGGGTIEWEIDVPKDGLYQISMHTYQSYNDGLPTYRQIKVDGNVPFSEMLSYKFKYSDSWYIETLQDENKNPYLFYLSEGTHTLSMTTSMSDYQPSIEKINDTLEELSLVYREIRMLTGSDIDVNYEYNFFKNIPDLEERLIKIKSSLDEIYNNIFSLSEKMPAVLNTVSDIQKLIGAIIDDDEKINKRIDEISNATTDLGDLISTLQSQPLCLDYFVITKPGETVKAAKVSAWKKIAAFCNSFLYSFQADYTKVGISGEIDEDTKVLDVWVGRSTQWVEILDQLIEENFTKKTGIVVTTNTIPSSQLSSNSVNALMLAIVCGNAPDAALGVGSGSPVEFAIRDAAVEITQFKDYEEISKRFVPQIFTAVTYKDKVYALPETMGFTCLFYRKDILKQLGLKVPSTWQQVYDTVIPTLSQNSMQFFYGGGFDTFLYQYGGKYFTDDGRYSKFDSTEAYKAFVEWTELYTNYNVPVSANFFNRFRSGEIPMGIGGMGDYIQFSTIAPELYGKWGVSAIPGEVRDDGTIDNTSTGIVGTTAMIFSQSDKKDEAWEFLKWWTSEEIQTEYQQSLEACIGVAARWSSANIKAFEKLPWAVSSSDYFLDIIKNAAVTPVVLGSPYTSRHITNAFTRVITMGQTPRDSLEKSVKDIDKELKAKNEEFGIYY